VFSTGPPSPEGQSNRSRDGLDPTESDVVGRQPVIHRRERSEALLNPGLSQNMCRRHDGCSRHGSFMGRCRRSRPTGSIPASFHRASKPGTLACSFTHALLISAPELCSGTFFRLSGARN